MELKDKIQEIILTVYSFGSNKHENGLKVKDVATDRIMELIKEDRRLTSAMHSDGEGRCNKSGVDKKNVLNLPTDCLDNPPPVMADVRWLMKWDIGDTVKDEDGNIGIVGIRWNDGDFCTIENDAAHPNPDHHPTKKSSGRSEKCPYCGTWTGVHLLGCPLAD